MSEDCLSTEQPRGRRKLPASWGALITPLLLSVFMTFLVSLISTLRSAGLSPDTLRIWMGSWGISWVFAFPTLLIVLPLVRRLSAALVESDRTNPTCLREKEASLDQSPEMPEVQL